MLDSLLVGLAVLSQLVQLLGRVRGGLLSCSTSSSSLVSGLVSGGLVLLQLPLSPHGLLELLLDHQDLTLQFCQLLDQGLPTRPAPQTGPAVPQAQTLDRGHALPRRGRRSAQTGAGAQTGAQTGPAVGEQGQVLPHTREALILLHLLGEEPTAVAVGGVSRNPGGRLVFSLVAPGDQTDKNNLKATA